MSVHFALLWVAASLGAGPEQAAGRELAPPVRLQAQGEFIQTHHAAPFVVDWDGDGRLDLLVGEFAPGGLRIYRNVGSSQEPKFAAPVRFTTTKGEGRVPTG